MRTAVSATSREALYSGYTQLQQKEARVLGVFGPDKAAIAAAGGAM